MKRFICILISVLFACSAFAQKGLIVNDIPIYSTDNVEYCNVRLCYGIYRNNQLIVDSITKSEAIKIQKLMVLQQKETDSLLTKANAEIETMRKKNALFLRNKIIVEGYVSSDNYGVYPSIKLSAKVPINIKTRAKRVTFTVKFYNNINECTATRTASTTGFTDAGRWMYGEFNAYNVDCADADHIKIIRVDMQLENGQHLTQFIDEKKAPNDEEESEKILAKYCNSIETAWGKEVKIKRRWSGIMPKYALSNLIRWSDELDSLYNSVKH